MTVIVINIVYIVGEKNYGHGDGGKDDYEDAIQVREAYRVFDKERVGHITAAELRFDNNTELRFDNNKDNKQ